jgi:hypothetical protein
MFWGMENHTEKGLAKRDLRKCALLVHGNKTFAFLLCSLELNMNKYEQNVQVNRHKANHNS